MGSTEGKVTKRQRLLKNLVEHQVEAIIRGNNFLGYYQMDRKLKALERLQKRLK